MPSILERLPVSECKRAQHERDLGCLSYRLGLRLTGLRTEVRNDLVVAGHDRVFGSHTVGLTTINVGDIDEVPVARILRPDHRTVETNFDSIT